jgi:hypothetical protein
MFHLFYPIVLNIFYLYFPKKEIQNFNSNYIFLFSLIHNSFLHVFSLYTFVSLSTILFENGIVAKRQYYFNIEGVDSLLFWFYLSKYYEFIDTFILYAKKKEPIFLQKYHHIGATFMWHLGYIYKFDGILFSSLLNSGVHSIMYLYYLASLFPYKLTKYKVFITTGQVGQLLYGGIALPWFFYNIETFENKICIICFDCYIFVLLLLFGHFMYKNYFLVKKCYVH